MVINYLAFIDNGKGRKLDTTYYINKKELINNIDSSLTCVDTINEIKLERAKEIKSIIKLTDNKGIKNIDKIDTIIETKSINIEYKERIEINKKDIIKFENSNSNNMGQSLLNTSIILTTISYIFISYTSWVCLYKELKLLFK